MKLIPPPPDPSLPTPVYLFRFAFALRRSIRTLSRSAKSSDSSLDRLRTVQCTILCKLQEPTRVTQLNRESTGQTNRTPTRTIDPLIFTRFIRIVKVSQDFDQTKMSPSIVNHSLGTILDLCLISKRPLS